MPLSLPGERVRVARLVRRGEAWAAAGVEFLHRSPQRAPPACPHFGTCGGCSLQHWAGEPYRAWKSGRVLAALRAAGFADVPMRPLVGVPAGARRRMDLAVRRVAGGVRIGFHHRRSHEIVPIAACPVLAPALLRLIAALAEPFARLDALRREAAAVVNLLDTGPDILLRTDAELTAADRQRLAAFAEREAIARISWSRGAGVAEPAVQRGPVRLEISGVPVAPPPGAFLQAAAEGEAAIRRAVLEALPAVLAPRARVVELFAGIGSFTFAVAQRARVLAVEGDAAAAAALAAAARAAGLGARIAVQHRDLARQPLRAEEFAAGEAVVLDPPYAGAAAQIGEIARSAVRSVVLVSCNPAALARDGRGLAQAGFRVEWAQPIDQFLWSAEVESVIALRR